VLRWWAGLGAGDKIALVTLLVVLCGAAYQAVRVSIRFSKWCVTKYDAKVLDWLRDAEKEALLEAGNRNVILEPIFLSAIAAELGRPQKCVYQSLRRLERQGEVREYQKGRWLTRGAPTIDNLRERLGGARGRFSSGRS